MMLSAPYMSVFVGVPQMNVDENTYKGLVPMSPNTTPIAAYARLRVVRQVFLCNRQLSH